MKAASDTPAGSITENIPARKPAIKIGELLISEGFVTNADINRALAVQQEEKVFTKKPLGEIFVQMGFITEQDLDAAINHPTLRKNIGSLAIDQGLITKEDLELCLKNKKSGQLIGELLVDFGLLTRNDIGDLLQKQINSPKLGQVLMDLKLITEKELQSALRKQKSTRALGEILCDLKLVTPQDLNYVLEKYGKQVELAEVLIKLGFINENTLAEAKKIQAATSEALDFILLKNKFISSEQLQTALAKKHNLPFMHLQDFAFSEKNKTELTSLLTQKYAEKNLILPISLLTNSLTIAIYRPDQLIYVNELKSLYPQLTINPAIITEEKFEELFEILYSKKLSAEALSQDEGADDGEIEAPQEEIDFMEIDLDENFDESQEQAPVYGQQDLEAEELVNFIVKYGILNSASDIHIEQDRQGIKLRYRIDGILQESNVNWLKHKMKDKVGAIVSRIKVMSNLDIAEKRMPQDGVFRINYYDKANNQKFDLDFRVATCSGIVGENVVIRILDSRKANVGIDNLGHSPHVIDSFKRLLKSSAGMLLVSGPTGSGKSSSLYGALKYVYNPGIKIITAEDPIEYSFPGIMQTQTNVKINLTFVRLLKSFLRLDPDVILVGEMRDNETSSIGFDAAQTGHLMLSTIHTNDSVSAISRLLDMDIEHGQIANCLLAVLAQRLIRKICPFCKKDYVPGEEEWGVLFDSYPSDLQFYTGEGCESCNYSGYKGRTLISEIFVIDKEIGAAISKGSSEGEIKKIAIEAGMKTMLDDGLTKMHDTTLYEILRVVPHDMIELFRSRKQIQADTNDLIDNLFGGGGGKVQVDLNPKTFMLSDPGAQQSLIDEMFEKYSTLNKINEPTYTGDSALFAEFITECYQNISQQYQCETINVTIRREQDKTEISALPGR